MNTNNPCISDEMLPVIEEAASNLLTIRDIARLIMIDEDFLRREIALPNSQAHDFYYRGKTYILLELRKQEIKLALSGSPQAVDKALDFINDMNDDELL